jgi:peptidyl-prolyl cis-trans isomerase D
MIENLRKYTGLIIVLFVLVIIGFIFMDVGNMNRGGGGMPYIKVSDRTYSDKEFGKLGSSGYQVTQSLAQSGDFQLYSFLFGISGNADFGSQQAMENFFANRMLLRSAQAEFGVHPGDEEIDSFIRRLRAFTGPDGEFSQEQYRNFIERGIGRLGLTEGDIRELASDVIAQTKLSEILGAGLTADRDAVAKETAINGQRIAVDVARIDLAPIKEKIDPSEEEIKTYWETVQDAFKTPEKRRFTYLIAKPNLPAEPAEIPAPADDATDGAKEEYETAKAAREAAIAEERRKAQLAAGGKADDFLYQLESQPELTFEKLAEDNNWELKTTELFALSGTPEDLKAPLRASSSEGTAADELFRMIVTTDPLSKISPAIAIGENEWLIARLDETEEVRPQTYEEARDEARARLIAELSATALKAAVEEAAGKIKAAIAEGKSFADAAKDAGITSETVSLPEVTAGYQGDTTKVPATLFDAAKYTDPGHLTEPVIESDRAFIIHVGNREILKQEDAEFTLEAGFKRAEEAARIAAFTSWLAARTEAANVETLYAK